MIRYFLYTNREVIKGLGQDDYYLYYCVNNTIFVGFAGYWKINNYFYIEYVAISAELKEQGYGQKVLKQFYRNVGKVILEIDPVIVVMQYRTKLFYLLISSKNQ